MRRLALSGWGLIALVLAGCGFQLRGQAPLPPELAVVSVQSQQAVGAPPGTLSRKLPLLLANSGVTVTRDPARATATITILSEGSGRRAVAADRFDIKRQYFLVYYATYQVTLANGKTLIPAEGISTNRTLLFDENQVLGFEASQEFLADSMADDLAWQILRRLQAIKS
jgi:LPS-assembly lipoprotein